MYGIGSTVPASLNPRKRNAQLSQTPQAIDTIHSPNIFK